MSKIIKVLSEIQCDLHCEKGQKNSFGNYSYRSCEDILEALKPHLKKQSATITLSDTIEEIGERYYIKAIASLNTADEHFSVTAYAREQATRKGMDESQITGSASSYARKYALSGLLALDGSADADAMQPETPAPAKTSTTSKKQSFKATMQGELKRLGIEKFTEVLGGFGYEDILDIPKEVQKSVYLRLKEEQSEGSKRL